MSIDHILASITSTPLMITPDKLAVIMDVLSNRQHISLDLGALKGLVPASAAAAPVARPANQAGVVNVATIPIVGSLVNRYSDGDSGMANYRQISQQLDRHMSNPDVGGIVLDIDSHGGMAAGAHRLATKIREASKTKPIYAFVDASAFSAAYYLASAASKIILADETAGVGSVGVIALHRDQSGHNEKEGYVYTAIYSGARKTDYSPHHALAEELVTKIQQSVNASRISFASAVASFRGLERAVVLDTEAGLFHGREALQNGFADEIATMEEAVGMLVKEILEGSSSGGGESASASLIEEGKTKTGGSEMTTKERLEALISGNEDAVSALTELGFVNAENAESTAKEAGHKEGLAAGLAQAKEIMDVATLGNAPLALTASMIEKRLTQEEAMTAVQQHRANNSAGAVINSTITPLSGDGKHPLLTAVEEQVGA